MKKTFFLSLILCVCALNAIAQIRHVSGSSTGQTLNTTTLQAISRVDRVGSDGLGISRTVTSGTYANVEFVWTPTALNGAFAATDRKSVATFTSAGSGNDLTATAHGLVVGDIVSVSTTTTLPAPLVAATPYYVVAVPTANTFQLSATSGGGAITLTSTGAGTQSALEAGYWNPQSNQIVFGASVITTDATTATPSLISRVDSTAAQITIKSPLNPVVGMSFGVKDALGTSLANNVIVLFQTDKLEGATGTGVIGQPNSYVINQNYGGVVFEYVDATRGWVVKNRIY